MRLRRIRRTTCPECGSTNLLRGPTKGACKDCGWNFKKPRGGWRDADGKRMGVIIFQCTNPACPNVAEKKEPKMFGKRQDAPADWKPICPMCGFPGARVSPYLEKGREGDGKDRTDSELESDRDEMP